MNKLLSGSQLEDAIRKLLAEGKSIKVAVAYWGKGATERRVDSEAIAAAPASHVADLY